MIKNVLIGILSLAVIMTGHNLSVVTGVVEAQGVMIVDMSDKISYLTDQDENNIIMSRVVTKNFDSIDEMAKAVNSIIFILQAMQPKKQNTPHNDGLTPTDLRNQNGRFYNLYEGELFLLCPSEDYARFTKTNL